MTIDTRTEIVRRFYDGCPFPGYPPHDNLAALWTRAGRSMFAQRLDRAIPADARIVEIGCGTGQMSLYLARANRVIVAADISHAALMLGHAAARRFGIRSVKFVQTDLHCAGLTPGSFDVVFSAGVLHHAPAPAEAFRRVAQLARPGGVVIVGVYNAVARIPLRLRRAVARLTRFTIVPFDPILRERDAEPDRRQAWLRDQYRHPEEHRHTLGELKRWCGDSGVEYLRSFPSTVFGDGGQELFAAAVDDWTVECWIAQAEWMWTLGREGGLFFTIGRRPMPASTSRV